MAVSTGNFAELLWPGIEVIFGNTYNDYEALYPKVFEKKKSTLAFEKNQGVTGLPLAGIKNQGNSIPSIDPQQGFQKEYVNITYAIGSSITRELYEDDQYSYIKTIPTLLARSLYQTEETTAFNVLNNGFNSSITGADGIELFSTAHLNVDGSTFSNRLATDSDLTQTSLETALQDLLDFVDDQSLKIRVQPKCLVVPTASNFRARKLLESSYVVGKADNDINPVQGLFQDLVVSPYLTDNDAWFIITDVPNGLTFYTRREVDLDKDNEFATQNLLFSATKRWSVSWTDPRGAFGTPGV
ncbi:MAG: Mu-like prophage major head subunit gpT family protein [Candidatus Brocadiales bacterium]|nr:Mu-like prophage major head subunit gpT family protein [Candidatus Bathyanammoxibius sp.]